MADDFIVPPYETPKPLPTEKEANDTAFYTAATSEEDPVGDFHSVKNDLQSTGQSDKVDKVQAEWVQEQQVANKEVVGGIMGDSTVPPEVKKQVLMDFALSAEDLNPDLKARYIQKTASLDDYSETLHQRTAQDGIVDGLRNRKQLAAAREAKSALPEDASKWKSFLVGAEHTLKGVGNTLGITSDEDYAEAHKEYQKNAQVNPISTGLGGGATLIASALPAVFAGGPVTAIAAASGLGGFFSGASRYAELGQTEGLSDDERLNASVAAGGLTGVEFALPGAIGVGVLKSIAINGGGNIAISELNTAVQNHLLKAFPQLQEGQFDLKNMTVNGALGAVIGLVFGRKAIQPAPSIPVDSPAAATKTANPAAAAHVGAQAVGKPSAGLAEMMGTDVGAIANDWALPKALDDIGEKDHPDLARELKRMDGEFKGVFEDYRYDPSIINVTKRDEDAAKMIAVANENTGSYYQQANSTVNFTDGVSEGVMVFGPDASSKFTSYKDAVTAASKLAEGINKLPPEEVGELRIVGTGTAQKVTKKTTKVQREIEEEVDAPKGSMTTFQTSKGSTYVHKDGITIRDKAARPEHPGEEGIQPKSDATIYVTKDQANLLGEVQAKGGAKRQIAKAPDGRYGVQYTSGKDKGKFEGRTMVTPKTEPEVGLHPVELIKGKTTHFGNEITKINKPAKIKQKKTITENVVTEHIEQVPQGPFHVEWKWKKEYDDHANWVFGSDSVRPTVLGISAAPLARSWMGNWIFSSGRFGKKVEQGAMRGVEREAVLREEFLKPITNNISKSKHTKELNDLIDEAESLGVDSFTKGEISGKFPDLSTKEVSDLFETHTYWRRMNDYFYEWSNREMKNKLTDQGMQGVYNNNGDYLGPAAPVTLGDTKNVREIWDYGLQKIVQFDPKKHDLENKTIVRLGNPIRDGGTVHNFALVGSDSTLGILPTKVLPKIPGYSPRTVRENFYVTMTPKALHIDGLRVTDANTLRSDYSKSVAAARNERDANKLAEQAAFDNPDHHVWVRPERTEAFGSYISDYEIHKEMFKQGQKRGERLPSKDGTARIDDRMKSAIKMANSLARMGAFRQWENNFQKGFTKGFSDYLLEGKFPQKKDDIIAKKQMSREEEKEFKAAQRYFEYYSKMKSFETRGDFLWNKSLHWVSDVLEGVHIPASALRDVGKKGNIPVNLAKQLGSAFYIHLNPIRQWLIQPAQTAEMWAVNPATAAKSAHDLITVRMAIAAEAGLHRPELSKILMDAARKSSMMDNADFDATIAAIKESGMIQSIDLNVLVHGLFKEVDKNLVETKGDTASRIVSTALKALPRVGSSVGFNPAELTNRIGLYLQAKELWKQQNPGENWNTKENRATIAAEGQLLSGNMNKSGNLPYQEGALSTLFQFMAIGQKLLINLIQDNATIMTPAQRTRLAAVRLVGYGYKYGIPGGAIISQFVDTSEDPAVTEGKDVLERGLVDYVTNNMIAKLIDPDTPSDIALAKSITPYSENFLPAFEVGVQLVKMFDGDPVTNPRFASLTALSSVSKAVTQIQGWFVTRDLNSEQTFKYALEEVAELSSGFSNYSKAMVMMGAQDIVTANGNKLGFQTSLAEAYAKIFGIGSVKEASTYDYLKLQKEEKDGNAQMVKDIHKQLMNQRSKIGTEEFGTYVSRLNAFISLLPKEQFNQASKIDIVDKVMALDRYSYQTTQQSIFADMWKNYSDEATDSFKERMDIMRRSKDPATIRLVKMLEEGNL